MISQEPMQIASVYSGDLYRFLLIGLIVLGVLVSMAGVNLGGLFNVA